MHISDILFPLTSLSLGLVLGSAFGLFQASARLRHERMQRSGNPVSGWSNMPGSGQRVALFLIGLAATQFLFPTLFSGGNQWWVSGGIGAGYGWILLSRIRQRRAENL